MSMPVKELFLETIKKNGSPDRLLVQWEALAPIMNDPLAVFTRGNRQRGKDTYDRWGTLIKFPEDAPAAMPHAVPGERVLEDITEWEEVVKVPDLLVPSREAGAWDAAIQARDEAREQGFLAMGFMGTGIFEQTHYLMGMEDALVSPLLEPEAAHELIQAIADYKFTYTKELVDNLKPDAILSHDDWGSKTALFFPPDIWREFFKPHYAKMYGYMRDNGVIVMHHADCYCADIVKDMVEIGVQVWQGAINTNDIAECIKETDGNLTIMGGIESAIDHEGQTEEEIRAATRKACEEYGPLGHYIPSMCAGLKNSSIYPMTDKIVDAEIEAYNKDTYGI